MPTHPTTRPNTHCDVALSQRTRTILATGLVSLGVLLELAIHLTGGPAGTVQIIRKAVCDANAGQINCNSGGLGGITNAADNLDQPRLRRAPRVCPIACLVGAAAVMFGHRRGRDHRRQRARRPRARRRRQGHRRLGGAATRCPACAHRPRPSRGAEAPRRRATHCATSCRTTGPRSACWWLVVAAVEAASLLAPSNAQADLNPFHWVGSLLSGATGLTSSLFVRGFVAILNALFSGFEAKLTLGALTWLTSIDNQTRQATSSALYSLTSGMSLGLLGAVLTVSIVRYWIVGTQPIGLRRIRGARGPAANARAPSPSCSSGRTSSPSCSTREHRVGDDPRRPGAPVTRSRRSSTPSSSSRSLLAARSALFI